MRRTHSGSTKDDVTVQVQVHEQAASVASAAVPSAPPRHAPSMSSSQPPPGISSLDSSPNKRQRTMVDAFQGMTLLQQSDATTISLMKNARDEQAEMQHTCQQSQDPITTPRHPQDATTATTLDGMDDSSENDEDMSSEEQIQNRAIVYQLAMGRAAGPGALASSPDAAAIDTPADPVDAKLEELIRMSRWLATQQALQQPTLHTTCQDDFHVFRGHGPGPFSGRQTNGTRPRSNSLPKDWMSETDDMDIDL